MSFTNVYYKRTAATARPCYVCHKPTPVVLATVNTVDFIYSCESHLKDRGFATQIQDEQAKPAVSADEIARVKAEYEEKQQRKKEKEEEKKRAKESEGKEEGKKDEETAKTKSPTPTPTSPSPSQTPSATHQKYSLHRDYFTMRQDEHRRKRQAAQAKELAPRLPGAPRGAI
ncbi:DUF1742-domain-containing protein [Cylindrobasidium torrendii FP15055 ss-10]|uniref:DUF1742-domain-containing protein n=1 Tax=Cylindrobasidium torrendii FP15055 ss-10 TaxID=1314674 RepID=A0A0D7BTI8_9AGAR|nr:DUF1742-domain-containing protein [Cylindrobasidium torrendii FP15055 ss-10]